MSKIVIDLTVLDRYSIKPQQFLYLMSKQYKITNEDIIELHQNKKFLNQGLDGTYYLNREGNNFINRLLTQSIDPTGTSAKEAMEIVSEMRALFPNGKKSGTNTYWRGNIAELRDRLLIFLKKHGNYPKEDIIKATKQYVDSFDGNYQLMRVLKYFIFKKNSDGSYEYDLLTQLENLGADSSDSSYVSNAFMR